MDLRPSLHWPEPTVARTLRPEDGPVLVMIEYHIDPVRADEFAVAMDAVRLGRRRDGAMRWGLFSDAADPSRYVETFLVESWVEHMRQHERVTGTDRAAQEQRFDARFEEVNARLDERIEEVKRHTGVLVEGLRHELHIVAEGLMTHIDVRHTEDRAYVDQRLQETNSLIRLSFETTDQLRQRLENLERKFPN